MRHATARSATVLLIVAGLSGLLASLAIAFLTRVQSDLGEMAASLRETQARIMLSAACAYIQEASRIGWEPRQRNAVGEGFVEHPEAHGWIDVRDGSLGPRLNSLEWSMPEGARSEFQSMQASGKVRPLRGRKQPEALFPVGVARRFPMYMVRRPPFAIQARTGSPAALLNATGVSDGRYFADDGIEIVNFGPGSGADGHAANESVPLDQMADSAAILLDAVRRFVGLNK